VPGLDSAWRTYTEGIEALRRTLHAMPIARTPADHAAADRWLIQAQAAAHALVLAPDPRRPTFLVHNLFEPHVFNWLLPNPDFLYRYAFLDGAGSYRIEGLRRNTHFLDAQTLRGFWGDPDMRLMDSHSLDEVGTLPDGRIEIHVGPEPRPGQAAWIRTDPSAARITLIVREAFYDWEKERRSDLRIEPLARSPQAGPPDAAETARRLEAALRMIRFCHQTFSGQLTADVVAAVGTNRFRLIDTSRDEAAANPTAGYVPAVFELESDEALILEFEIPRSTYWGLQVGDVWWQAADYVDRQSSLNGRQVEPDSDGRARIVLCAEDPGVPNWLDTAGLSRGVVLLRWYRADRHPVPTAKIVGRDRIASALPAETPRITPDERRRRLAIRRESVLRRYGEWVAS
jgi:hypothetical protein